MRSTLNYDDSAIDRWQVERPLKGIQLPSEEPEETSPPLWKDLALASVVAVLLWGAVAMVLA